MEAAGQLEVRRGAGRGRGPSKRPGRRAKVTEPSWGHDPGGAPGSPPRRGRHVSYHRLLEAFQAPGCALCLLSHEAVDRYLDGVLYEKVNDPDLRQSLARSRGFCRDHAWVLLGFGDSLGTALLYRDQVARALQDVRQAARGARSRRRSLWSGPPEEPSGVLRSLRAPAAPCPACRVAEDAEARYLDVLLQFLDEPEMLGAVQRSRFLCLPHVARAVERARTPERAAVLLELAEGALHRLHRELGELIRKRDYRFAHEPRGQEQTAWLRAVACLVGWWRPPNSRRRLTDPDTPL